jgi:ankyrin repeat protein
VKALVEAYPSALLAPSEDYGNSLCQAASRSDSEGRVIVQYLYEKRPSSIREALENNWVSLHYASRSGSFEIIEFLLERAPGLAAELTFADDSLPLHFLLDRFRDKNDPPVSRINMLRLLLRYYPEGAGKADHLGDSPYDLAVKVGMSTLIQRLLLRADPTIDPTELRRLNYVERRMAMFLAYSAMPQNTSNSFVARLRRVKNKDESLLRLIISFL